MKLLFLLGLVSMAAAASHNFTSPYNDNITEILSAQMPSQQRFMASLDNSSVAFSLEHGEAIIFVLTIDAIFKQATWLGGDIIFLSINATNKGVGVLLPNNKEHPNLLPQVINGEFHIDKRLLESVHGHINVHLIALNGPTDGFVTLTAQRGSGWVHIHIIVVVLLFVVLTMMAIRICADRLLRAVYSYQSMADFEF